MESLFFIINLILLVGLIGLIIYESKQIKHYQDIMAMFIDSNSEIFGVVNANAEVSRQMGARLEGAEKVIEFIKVVIDAHAHALRVYGPMLDLDPPISDSIQSIEES